MNERLSAATLAAMGARVAVLNVGRYALPVPVRIREPAVECRVPTWTGVGDMLAEPGEVTLVAVRDTGAGLCWLFLRGLASVVPNPDWGDMRPPAPGGIDPDDLYQLVRVQPQRIERIDERRGWGVRETADL
jgi:hypothetical protein